MMTALIRILPLFLCIAVDPASARVGAHMDLPAVAVGDASDPADIVDMAPPARQDRPSLAGPILAQRMKPELARENSTKPLSADERRAIERAIENFYLDGGGEVDSFEFGSTKSNLAEVGRFIDLAVLNRGDGTVEVRANYDISSLSGYSNYRIQRRFTLKIEREKVYTVIKPRLR